MSRSGGTATLTFGRALKGEVTLTTERSRGNCCRFLVPRNERLVPVTMREIAVNRWDRGAAGATASVTDGVG